MSNKSNQGSSQGSAKAQGQKSGGGNPNRGKSSNSGNTNNPNLSSGDTKESAYATKPKFSTGPVKFGNGQSWPIGIKSLVDQCKRADLHLVADVIDSNHTSRLLDQELKILKTAVAVAREQLDKATYLAKQESPWGSSEETVYNKTTRLKFDKIIYDLLHDPKNVAIIEKHYIREDIVAGLDTTLTDFAIEFHALYRNEEMQRHGWDDLSDHLLKAMPKAFDSGLRLLSRYEPGNITKWYSTRRGLELRTSGLTSDYETAKSQLNAHVIRMSRYTEKLKEECAKVISGILSGSCIQDTTFRNHLNNAEDVKELAYKRDILSILNIIKGQYDPLTSIVDLGSKLSAWTKMEPKKDENFNDFWDRYIKEKMECIAAGCQMPIETLQIVHIQEVLQRKYEDPSDRFITRILERQLLPVSDPDHRPSANTVEEFKSMIYGTIKAKYQANPKYKNVDPNLAYRSKPQGKEDNGKERHGGKKEPAAKDEVTAEEVVGAVQGKANPKQGQQAKTKPECNICFGKFHNLAESSTTSRNAPSSTRRQSPRPLSMP